MVMAAKSFYGLWKILSEGTPHTISVGLSFVKEFYHIIVALLNVGSK